MNPPKGRGWEGFLEGIQRASFLKGRAFNFWGVYFFLQRVELLDRTCVFPQQQNAMGSLHNIDFGVCWASWGGSGKKTGSGKVPGTVPGTGSDGFRGLDRFQGSEVWIGSKVPRLG